jgi:hypothetical protein
VTGPLRRQGETHVPGAHALPPRVPHQVRELNLRVEPLPGGGVRVSTPQARGWAAVAKSESELARAVLSAFTEVQIAAYSAWKGQVYDLDALTDVDPADPKTALPAPPVRRNRTTRSDVAHPSEWARLPDGRWRSPRGRVYGPESQLVRRVVQNRRALGIVDD